MKNLSLFLFTAFAVVLLLPSCNDSDGDYPSKYAFAAVKTLENNDYYFVLDDTKTLYPTDKRHYGSYKATDGQRVKVFFNFLSPKVEGYDYNIALYEVQDILTKDIKVITTAEELEKIGDDPLSLVASQIRGGFIDIQFGISGSAGSKHEMNLIVNDTQTPGETLEGYTNLEFRQKSSDSSAGYDPSYRSDYLVAFRLGDLDPAKTGSKGFYIRIRNMYGNIEYIKVDAPKEEK